METKVITCTIKRKEQDGFDRLREILIKKLKSGVYYLILDEAYFEQLGKYTLVTREIYTLLKNLAEKEPNEDVKYTTFKTLKDTKTLYNFIQELNKLSTVFVTVLNKEENECFILFMEKEADFTIEKAIYEFIEMED